MEPRLKTQNCRAGNRFLGNGFSFLFLRPHERTAENMCVRKLMLFLSVSIVLFLMGIAGAQPEVSEGADFYLFTYNKTVETKEGGKVSAPVQNVSCDVGIFREDLQQPIRLESLLSRFLEDIEKVFLVKVFIGAQQAKKAGKKDSFND
jgi:hypothetical protein